jgi:hypothetical protein
MYKLMIMGVMLYAHSIAVSVVISVLSANRIQLIEGKYQFQYRVAFGLHRARHTYEGIKIARRDNATMKSAYGFRGFDFPLLARRAAPRPVDIAMGTRPRAGRAFCV